MRSAIPLIALWLAMVLCRVFQQWTCRSLVRVCTGLGGLGEGKAGTFG
jgi:hypothetical protein